MAAIQSARSRQSIFEMHACACSRADKAMLWSGARCPRRSRDSKDALQRALCEIAVTPEARKSRNRFRVAGR